jgi:4-carboxymuconolactone decarboxylase
MVCLSWVARAGSWLVSQEEIVMATEPAAPRSPFADIAPALADYTDKVLFGDMWKRPGLSQRERSLITVACLIALYRTNELPFHLKRALDNGLSRDELSEVITHLAFYSGWPTAATAVTIARRVFQEAGV